MINSYHDSCYIDIAENIKFIRNEIAESAIKSGRNPEDVRLMAVTKTVSFDKINFAIDECGVDLIGENKVQELLLKKPELHLDGVECHLIGHLQTNKVKKILPNVHMIQSVDSFRLAQAISNESRKAGIKSSILLEINIGGEDSKTGFDKGAFEGYLEEISILPNIVVKGLMTIPPVCESELEAQRYFASMNEYYHSIKGKKFANFDFSILSMGMSGDYKAAIAQGSNLVRVGSAIFGARIY